MCKVFVKIMFHLCVFVYFIQKCNTLNYPMILKQGENGFGGLALQVSTFRSEIK